MKLATVIPMRLISPGVMLIFLILAFPAYGRDTRFASGKSALAIPFEFKDNHIFLRVRVNGSPPLAFVLDTGASFHVLSLNNAKSFGLKLHPLEKQKVGVGANAQELFFVKEEVSFNLPGVVLSEQWVIAMSLDVPPECADQAPAGGKDRNVPSGQNAKEETTSIADGVLGKGFFDSFVVEIDYAARRINLYDPPSYQYTGKGKNLPLELEQGLTILRARVKAPGRSPVTARLLVDTGASTALTLNKPFAEAHKLLPPAEKLTATNECGVGGAAEGTSYEGTLEALEFGGMKLSNPLTFFRNNANGKGFDGLLGGAVLRNYKVIFDYSRRRMILESPR